MLSVKFSFKIHDLPQVCGKTKVVRLVQILVVIDSVVGGFMYHVHLCPFSKGLCNWVGIYNFIVILKYLARQNCI